MDTVKNAVNQGLETLQQGGAGAQKEANKQVAKDSNAPIGDRATAAKDAVGHKFDETKHDAKAEGYKQSK